MQARGGASPSPPDGRFRNPCQKVYKTNISGGRGGACSSSCLLLYLYNTANSARPFAQPSLICEDVKERPCDAPHPPQPRQKIAPSIRVFLPLRSNLLANIFPRGARLISVALIDKSMQDGHIHCLHRNGQPNEKDARREGVPRGEAGAVGD